MLINNSLTMIFLNMVQASDKTHSFAPSYISYSKTTNSNDTTYFLYLKVRV